MAEWQLGDKTITELPFGYSTDFSKMGEWVHCFVAELPFGRSDSNSNANGTPGIQNALQYKLSWS